MNRISRATSVFSGAAIVSAIVAAQLVSAAGDAWTPVEIRGGVATFEAATNVSAITVHGKTTELDARASVLEGAGGLSLGRVEATVPVKSLATGMNVRDEHMRKLIFTNPDGTIPDMKFVAQEAPCTPNASKGAASCAVTGTLAIRGIQRPFTMTLIVSHDANGFRAAGDGVVKLSTYGIEPPAQFGVRTRDEVKLHVDFTARPAVATTSTGATR